MNNLNLWEPRKISNSTVHYFNVWICSQNWSLLSEVTYLQRKPLCFSDVPCAHVTDQYCEFKRIQGLPPLVCSFAPPVGDLSRDDTSWSYGQ